MRVMTCWRGGGIDSAGRTAGAGADDASADGPGAAACHAVVRVRVHGEDHRILPTLRDEDVEHIDGWESERVLGLLG